MADIRNVLVVDGNAASSRVMIEALDSIGLKEIKYINNINDAKLFLEKERAVFIVLDHVIGGESSIGLVKWLRGSFNNPNYRAPILFMIGVPTKEEVTSARDAGVTELMVKPFKTEALKTVILSFLKNPRNFIISRQYVGPDRRRKKSPPPDGKERRVQIIQSEKKDE